MQKIVIDKNQLARKLSEIKGTGRVMVELSIVPGEKDDGIFSPAFLHVGCIGPEGTYEDHESVDDYIG